jgi:AcrR family transcriptional regulator
MKPIDADQLVDAAMELMASKGTDAISMRALAKRVDRQVSSLYNHIGSRDELIELIRARIVSGIDTSSFADEPWDSALERWARSYLAAFAAHPHLIRVLATTPIRDISTFEMYNVVIESLVGHGWPIRDAVAVMRTVEAHVLGTALDIVAPSDMLNQESVPTELATVRAALAPEHSVTMSAEAAFELGFEALMVGLRSRRAISSPDPASPHT